MQKNGHLHDFDITRLIPPEEHTREPSKNPILDLIESKPMPPKRARGGELSERQQNFYEALQLMVPCRDSILIEKNDMHHLEKARKKLGYRMTYRTEDNRGIKLYRFWVVDQTPEEGHSIK